MNLLAFAAEEAARQGVDPDLVLRVIHQESRGNPNAVSPKGARGPMQLMPATARGLGVDLNDQFDNVRGGVKYLKQQLDAFGDPSLALAAYNAGPGAVRRHGGIPPYAETQNYVRAIMGGQQGGQGQQSGADIFGMGAGPQAQQGGSGADIFADKPKAKGRQPIPQLPALKVTPAEMRTLANKGQPIGVGEDMGRSFASEAIKTVRGLADQTSSVLNPMRMLQQAAITGSMFTDMAKGKAPVPTMMDANQQTMAALSPNAPGPTANLKRYDHTPVTSQGQAAGSFGSYAPAALLPGTLGQRAATALLPAAATELSGYAAQKSGLGPQGVNVARTAGGIAGGIASGFRLAPNAKAQAEKPLSLEELQKATTKAYDDVKALGATYKPEVIGGLKADVKATLAAEGFDADLHPKVNGVLNYLNRRLSSDEPISLSELDQVRQVARRGIFQNGGTQDEKRLGTSIIQKIDDMIATSGPEQMAGGDGVAAAKAIAYARDMNTRFKKVETITDVVDDAGLNASGANSGQNRENAIRQAVKPLVKKRSAARMRNLTPEEAAAARKVVKGGFSQNATRFAGNLLTSPFAIAAAGAAGAPTGWASLGAIPIGFAAKASSRGMTDRNVQALIELMARGGSKPVGQVYMPQLQTNPGILGAPVSNGLFGAGLVNSQASR